MKGQPMTLSGEELEIGSQAPDCAAVSNDLKPVRISDFAGKIVILSFVPSLDTPVCDAETRRFNQEVSSLGDDVVILTVSMDLPFAQNRWCRAAGIDRVITISDYKDRCFAENYGVLIKEIGLHAREVFVLDRQGKISYKQLVSEVGDEPDYEQIFSHVKKMV